MNLINWILSIRPVAEDHNSYLVHYPPCQYKGNKKLELWLSIMCTILAMMKMML